jgi:hypothetical protein
MLVRVWFISYSLPQSELEKLRLVRRGLDHKVGPSGKVKIRYNKHRCAIERDFPSVEKAIAWVEEDREENAEFQGVYNKYALVFAACEAKHGEKCQRLEEYWTASEQELFSSETIEALTAK